jgi:hypothetical protein
MLLTQARIRLWPPSIAHRRALLDEYKRRENSTAGHSSTAALVHECDVPPIWRVHSFVSKAEADYIAEAYRDLLYQCPPGRHCTELTSELFTPTNDELLWAVSGRMDNIVQRFLSRSTEDPLVRFQFVRYGTTGRFPAHFDIGDDTPMPLTFMIYLNDVPSAGGGHTVFPRARCTRDREEDDDGPPLALAPRKGDLVAWSTCHAAEVGRVDRGTLHVAAPIHANGVEKLVLNKFYTADEIDPRWCVEGLAEGVASELMHQRATYLL